MPLSKSPRKSVCGFDPRDGHESIGGEGVLVVPDRFAPTVGTDLHGIHVGLHRHAEVGFVDLVMREQAALAVGRGAAVGPHRRDDERLRPEVDQRIDGRFRQHSVVLDPPAAAANGDAHTGANPRGEFGFLPNPPALGVDIRDERLRGGLANLLDEWNFHGESRGHNRTLTSHLSYRRGAM